MEADRIQAALEGFATAGGQAAQLVKQRRFVCWKRMPKENGSGFTKPPINPNTGYRVNIRRNAKDKSTGAPLPVVLFTAHEALEHMKGGRCDGIGIATGDFDGIPLCGIDVDHCVEKDGSYCDEYQKVSMSPAVDWLHHCRSHRRQCRLLYWRRMCVVGFCKCGMHRYFMRFHGG